MITQSDISNILASVNNDYTTRKNSGIESKRMIVLSVNDKILYYHELDSLLEQFDEIYGNYPIDINNNEFINLLVNRSNNLLNTDKLGSQYLKSCLVNFNNIKLHIVTIPYGNFNNQIVSSRQGTYRP